MEVKINVDGILYHGYFLWILVSIIVVMFTPVPIIVLMLL
jgi:hypothetical protein